MILWITLSEETHLMYQFVNAFLDRIRWAMLNLWDMFFHEEVPWNIWVIFEAVSCTKNVDHEWKSWARMTKTGKLDCSWK